jgi:hypothetical protein
MLSRIVRRVRHTFLPSMLAIFEIVAWPMVSVKAQSGQTIAPLGTSVNPLPTFVPKDSTRAQKERRSVPPNTTNGDLVAADDLTRIPEVSLRPLSERDREDMQETTPEAKHREALEKTKQLLARINSLNDGRIDGFLETLRDERSDLRGLPFALGEACRTMAERNKHFAAAARGAREISRGVSADVFWSRYLQGCALDAARFSSLNRSEQEHVIVSRIKALMQVLAPESAEMRLGLVKYLAALLHADASRALAKLAIFSDEDEIRQAAIAALKVRDGRDYTDILLQGMRYPWPPMASRACDVIAKLNRKDLLPSLVDLLEDADPRAPIVMRSESKNSQVVRELVRINHTRNCLLCHAPAGTHDIPRDALIAEIPLPGEPLVEPSLPYILRRRAAPGMSVRVDVTYLRPDFSMFQSMPNAEPGSARQRFDYLVRTRELTPEEAEALGATFDEVKSAWSSPYRMAAAAALRALTGEKAGPKAEAWRKILGLPQTRREQD